LKRELIRERIATLYQLLGGHKANYEVEIRELIESSKIEEKAVVKKLSKYFI
jgi:hypothetical protein